MNKKEIEINKIVNNINQLEVKLVNLLHKRYDIEDDLRPLEKLLLGYFITDELKKKIENITDTDSIKIITLGEKGYQVSLFNRGQKFGGGRVNIFFNINRKITYMNILVWEESGTDTYKVDWNSENKDLKDIKKLLLDNGLEIEI